VQSEVNNCSKHVYTPNPEINSDRQSPISQRSCCSVCLPFQHDGLTGSNCCKQALTLRTIQL
jgi:hypothetical protein